MINGNIIKNFYVICKSISLLLSELLLGTTEVEAVVSYIMTYVMDILRIRMAIVLRRIDSSCMRESCTVCFCEEERKQQ